MPKDTMYLICQANKVKANLVKANIIMAKHINDVPLSKKGVSNSFAKKSDLGYDHVYQIVQCDYVPLSDLITEDSNPLLAHLSSPYIESPGKPPNSVC